MEAVTFILAKCDVKYSNEFSIYWSSNWTLDKSI